MGMASNGIKDTSSKKIMTPSNMITIARICLVPVFVVALLSPWPDWFGMHDLISNPVKSIIACAIFILISCTDWLDGYLARSRNEVTDFGKFADPLADKILVIAALLALVELQVLPSWPVLIIITREFIVSGIRMLAATKGHVIAASWYGKAKTVTQIIAIVLFLLKDSVVFPDLNSSMHLQLYVIAWVVMGVALLLTVVSMFDYIKKAWPMFVSDGSSDSSCADLLDDCEKLAESVISKASSKSTTLSTAESLTGGMICGFMTSVAGSSLVVKGGVVSYALDVKSDLLGVDDELLKTCGAVNSQTAEQMAIGSRMKLGSDIAVSATGIAGPGGAEPGLPVGTVFLGISTPFRTYAVKCSFEGDRHEVRIKSALRALAMIDEELDSF